MSRPRGPLRWLRRVFSLRLRRDDRRSDRAIEELVREREPSGSRERQIIVTNRSRARALAVSLLVVGALVATVTYLLHERRELLGSCTGLPPADRIGCVEAAAVISGDASICTRLGAGTEDACMENVFRQAEDPAVCDTITPPGVQQKCKSFFEPRRSPD